ncbi:hypothetical protein K439DRAFT_116051 [Ramaria rubella]|nr:hypothetical protein K439DRAFT_116051 [Ramaria rubella]
MTLAPPEPLSLVLSSRDELAVECPRYGGPPVQVAWLREPVLASNGYAIGTDWCQNQFAASCRSCGFLITREAISVGRFAADIGAALMDNDAILPTLFDPITCSPLKGEAQRLTTLLLQPFVAIDLPPTLQAIGETLAGLSTGLSKLSQKQGTFQWTWLLRGALEGRKIYNYGQAS